LPEKEQQVAVDSPDLPTYFVTEDKYCGQKEALDRVNPFLFTTHSRVSVGRILHRRLPLVLNPYLELNSNIVHSDIFFRQFT